MIPKTIHYCWFGKNKKSDLILNCIESWKKYCPDYKIIEWNEENFDINQSEFTKKMYNQKKWAFVSDYVRLNVLEKSGGFYLDTDMLLLKSLEPLTHFDCVLGEELNGIISAGMIGATPDHPFIKECKNYYDKQMYGLVTIPRVLTEVYNNYLDKQYIKVYSPKTFYPFDSEHIKEYKGQDLGEDVIGVHLWNYSWGHPLNKFFKRIGIYNLGKKITEIFGIKKIIKKLLGFI